MRDVGRSISGLISEINARGGSVRSTATKVTTAGLVLNGGELARVRMGSTANHLQLPGHNQKQRRNRMVVTVAQTNMVVGDHNVLAAEIHQTSAGSSDIAFGMTLLRPWSRPIITYRQASKCFHGQSFQAVLSGIKAGYSVEISSALGTSGRRVGLPTTRVNLYDLGAAGHSPAFIAAIVPSMLLQRPSLTGRRGWGGRGF